MDLGLPRPLERAHPPAAAGADYAERRAAANSTAVTFAGGPQLADLLASRLHINPDKIASVPNGHDPCALAGLSAHRPRTDGTAVAQLTVIGGVSASIEADIHRAIGDQYLIVPPMPRPQLYRRLDDADAAMIPLDLSSAVESRIPTKVYDCLAVGTPIIALCPATAALLKVPDAERIHHVDYRDAQRLTRLLAAAAEDRSELRGGPLGAGQTRDAGVGVLDRLLHRKCLQVC